MIGIYGFFQIDFDSGTKIINVGKCEDKEKRTDDYRGTNAKINFHYFKEVPLNQLKKAEDNIKDELRKLGYKQWGNSREQFIVDDEVVTRQILSEYMSLSINNNYKHIDYEYNTLYGETKDIRDNRKNCAFIPRLLAMITTKVGLNEKLRYVKTLFLPNGSGINKLDDIKSVPISKDGWDVWQCAIKTATFKQEKGPF